MSKSLEYIKGKIADLEDDLQHYTMVDKDKAKEYFIKCELEKLYSLEKELKTLELIDYALEHSDSSSFTLPDGSKRSCDMGYVEDFMDIIRWVIE